MAVFDLIYRNTLKDILTKGYDYEDPNRKGVFRKEISSATLRHELTSGFPILTTKKTFFKGGVAELLFFLSGSTDIRDLWRRGVRFWDKDWARFHNYNVMEAGHLYNRANVPEEEREQGVESSYTMGRIYPAQYRNWNGQIDQFAKVVKTLKENPMSTSMIVNAWNPTELDNMALPPCHYGFQILGRPLSERERMKLLNPDGRPMGAMMYDHKFFDESGIPKYGFEIHWQQRSTDYFLGTPINIQYYALLAHLLGVLTGHKALAVQGDLKNVHLYDNQIDQAKELVERDVTKYKESTLLVSSYLDRVKNERHYEGTNLDEILEGLKVDDFQLDEYEYYPALKAEMLTYKK